MAARGKKSVVRELPAFIEPMLAKPADPFDSDEHWFEVKWDGTRAMCFVGAGGVGLMNRRRRDITFRYPDLACLKNLPKGTVLDGEIVVLRPDGTPNFAALQMRDQCEAARRIKAVARSHPAAYIVFDQLYERYRNVMDTPLLDRRERARATVARCGDYHIIMSEGVSGQGVAYFDAAVERGLEGVVAKRLDSRYFPGKRTDCWLKIKRCETIAAVVIGFIPDGSRDFGVLIVGTEIDGEPTSVGKVGSGFTERVRRQINDFLWAHLRETPVVPSRTRGMWVEPKLYCYVRCMERADNFARPCLEDFMAALVRGHWVTCVGRLASMSWEQFIDVIETLGGKYTNAVGGIGAGVSLVVIGQADWPLNRSGQVRPFLRQARVRKRREGYRFTVLSERLFLEGVGRREDAENTHPPLEGVPSN